ncbi:MAG: gliding motility protein GldL [Parabacteroides merdae]
MEQLSGMSENMERFSQVTHSLTDVSDTLLNSYKSITDNSDGINQNSRGYVQRIDAGASISGLNTIYEIQLKSISSQIESIEHINSGLSRIREMYDGSVVDSSVFRNGTEKMTRQLAELNQVYSRPLQAGDGQYGVSATGAARTTRLPAATAAGTAAGVPAGLSATVRMVSSRSAWLNKTQ